MSGVLINLLPDLRQAKLREKRRRQMVSGVAVAVWVVCGGLIALLAVYAGGQKVLISNSTKNIAASRAELEANTGLIDALTAHQHLASLPALYAQRVYVTKFFNAYMEVDPKKITLNSLDVDATRQLSVRGAAPTYAEVAKLARVLAASNVTLGSTAQAGNQPYFREVTITTVDSNDTGGVNFTITAKLGDGVTNGSR